MTARHEVETWQEQNVRSVVEYVKWVVQPRDKEQQLQKCTLIAFLAPCLAA